MSPAKEISRDTLKLLATTIAEPIKANVNDGIYERVVELIALAFDEAQIKRIPDPRDGRRHNRWNHRAVP